MNSFSVDLESFKQAVAMLTKAIENKEDDDSIEQGWKCVSLLWLNGCWNPGELLIADSYFNYASRKYLDYTVMKELV